MTSDGEIAAVARAWIRYNITQNDGYFWAFARAEEWLNSEQIGVAWRFVVALCSLVECNDMTVIANIGAGPVEDFIVKFGDSGLDLVERAVKGDPVLLKALAMVWAWDSPERSRVDRILVENGQERL